MNLKNTWVPISKQLPAIKEGLFTLLELKGLRQPGWEGLDSLAGFPTWLKEGSNMDAPSKCHAKQGPQERTSFHPWSYLSFF